MYAIVECGGRQYRAEEGRNLSVEKLPYEVGEQIELDNVLLLSNGAGVQIGQPSVSGASILATVVDQYRGKKIFVWKYKPKKRYRRRRGHRQYYTKLRVDTIVTGGGALPQETHDVVRDDLKKIEGIGPKIAATLADAGINSYSDLANATVETLSSILSNASLSAVPNTWPQQAQLAADGKWDELATLQDELDGGRA
jgi:large subunit ribosomal protein L21